MAKRVTDNTDGECGFTLIELLVVFAIVAFAAGFAVLNAPPPRNEARMEAERLAINLQRAGERAIMDGILMGLEISPQGYEFYSYGRGAWAADVDGSPKKIQFRNGLSVEITIEGVSGSPLAEKKIERGEDATPAPQIFLTPTGETTAADISVRGFGERWIVAQNATGQIAVRRDD